MSWIHTEITRFLVTTPGLSATRWLSFVLASRPDVFVAHGKHSLESVVEGRFENERASGDASSLALGNVMSDFYRCRTLDEVFETYRRIKPRARACGNVHSYTLDEVTNRFGPAARLEGLRVVNVLRHPVTYIASHASMVRTARDYRDLHDHYRRIFEEVLAQCPELLLVECDDLQEFEVFAVSCYSASRFLADLRCEWAPYARMEDLTSDVDRLIWFCEYLTRVPYDRARLTEFIEDGPINRHRQNHAGKSANDVYDHWQDWQRDVAALLLPTELLDRFTAAGYDVSMLIGENRTSPVNPRASQSRAPACLADFVGLPADEGQPAAAPIEPPILVEEGYRGFNVVRCAERYIAAAQALGPVDLTQVDEAWLAARHAAGEAFIGNSLIDAHRQIDQLAADEIIKRLAELQEQLNRLSTQQACTENAVIDLLSQIRLPPQNLQAFRKRISAAGWRVCRQVISQLRKSARPALGETQEADPDLVQASAASGND
jgi:hypothetical protein